MGEQNADSLNIMVVDDSGITTKKLSKLLEELGHTVVGVARTGKEAVEMYNAINPDIVTMDITMPGMDGIEATQAILKKFKDALIIMVTSHNQEAKVLEAIRAGAVGYVIKPFKPDTVQRSIDRVIETFMMDA